ncbi:S8 family serine peptidase [Bacillus sp. CH30_1T]|uniref:S8 family serine peptidase n=1 Tax=Bacillus sp. CH30_1T TaxID=2604836 RepID=UPI0011EDB2CD|nr:S8 family serine peptidase [Bacillus sp. CH30_1T]KAA0566671.1 S8 family serine peptidase [Bacillus sp. CH30_1T]
MKGSLKRRLSVVIMFVLLISSFVTPAGAQFYQSKQEPVQFKGKDKDQLFSDLTAGEDNHPLYGQDSTTINPNEKVRLIVEVEVNEKAKSAPEQLVEQVKNTFMKKRGGDTKVLHTYSTGFYGFSMEMKREEAMNLKEAEGVKDIRLAKTYEHMDVKSNELVEAMNVWTKYNYSGDGMVVAIVDSGIDYRHEALKLSEKGKKKAKFNEENVQAELDDTEVNDVWYTDKVPTGYDWADKDNNVIPASDSHGTHVAGIVGAYEETQQKAVGVSPDVQLLAEKVFSDTRGFAYDDDIVAGIYHAVELGADVINLSLGSDAGMVDPNDPVQRAIEYATEQGVLVVAAAGNASYSTKQNLLERSLLPLAKNPDIGLVGDPGVTPSALQVASSENDMMRIDTIELNDGSLLGYQLQPSSKKLIDSLEADKEYELVFVGDTSKGALEGLDLQGKIAVAQYDQAYDIYSSAQFNVNREGAIALILIPANEHGPYATVRFSPYTIPAVTTDINKSVQVAERLQSGEKITAKLSTEVLWVQNPANEPMSNFSSYGSPTDLSFKPEITAPGGKISSTVLNNQYETWNGTSMATPHVAGGAALLLQKYYQELGLPKNEETVLKAKMALMNTSEILKDPNGENVPYSPRRQGSGLMKIEQAVETPYLLKQTGAQLEQAASVALKEVENNFKFSLTVDPLEGNVFSVFQDETANPDDSEITFQVSDKSMGNLNFETKFLEGSNIREHASLKILNSSSEDKNFTSSIEYSELSNDAEKNGVQFSVSNKVKVKAGKSKKTNVFLSVPKTAGEGIYEGYITFVNEEDDTEKYQVPFAVNVAKPTEYDVYVDVLKDGTVTKEFDFNEDGNVDESNEYLTLSSERVENASVKVNGKKISDQNGTTISMKDKDVELNVSVELPEEFRDNQFVEGFVRLVPKNEETPSLTMPYMGFYGNWDSIDNIDESPVNGDPYLGYTVLWNDMLQYPLGFDLYTNSFDQEKVGYSHKSLPTGMYPSFTAFRNLKEMSLKVEDEQGNEVAHITNFTEYTEDGSPFSFRKNIMSYGDYYYGFDGLFWSGKDDEGNNLPDGKYYYVYESTLNYEGAESQQTKIPFKIDSVSPDVENIKVTDQPDGTYKITWDVKEESDYLGSILWINDHDSIYDLMESGEKEYITSVKPETVMVLAVDNFYNTGFGYAGNEELLHAGPFIQWWHVSGTNVNENKPASITVFGYNRMDWHIEISDAEGHVVEYVDIENEHSLYGLEWNPSTEYPDGEYYVTVTGTDDKGFSLTSEPETITVKH